jgi:hypothetical protein
LALTRPASSIQKPQAMNMTKKPDIRNSSEFKMNTLCAGASCAKAGLAISPTTPARGKDFNIILTIGNS